MKLIDIHTHKPSASPEVFSVLNLFPEDEIQQEAFSIGVHPWYISEISFEEQLCLVKQKAGLASCKAIGECGLDKVTNTPYQLQESIFKTQVSIAEELEKPMLIHCVKSFQEIYKLRVVLQPKQTWVIHGFVKGKQLADQLISVGIKLSFGSALLTNVKLQEVFKGCNSAAFFLETDDAACTIQEVYLKAADLRGVSVEALKNQIDKNYNSLFTL